MSFHLGKPILVMLVLAVLTGLATLRGKSTDRPDLVVWTFADSHAMTYRDPLPASPPAVPEAQPSLLDQFFSRTGLRARVDLMSNAAESIRLVSLFMSHAEGDRVPDLCEIEIGNVGKYFRPPVDDVGFLPLNDYLQKSGDYDRVVKSRFAPWSKIDKRTGKQIIFGVPNDLHATTISYRKDLFDEADVDLESAKTWPEFQEKCLEFQRYRAAHGRPDSFAMELYIGAPELLVTMLLQRHVNIVDEENRVHLDDPVVAETVAFYAQLVAGPRRIGVDTTSNALWSQDLAAGNVCAAITPDWRVSSFHEFTPSLRGKMRMMPLPIFRPGDAPTSTWGGTMIGIPRACKHPDDAYKLLRFLYLSREGNEARLALKSDIIPPVRSAWSDAAYHQPDPFFGGQKVDELYISLADQIPERFVTPYSTMGQVALAVVQNRAVAYVDAHGTDGLQGACAGWLTEAQRDLQRRINYGKIDP